MLVGAEARLTWDSKCLWTTDERERERRLSIGRHGRVRHQHAGLEIGLLGVATTAQPQPERQKRGRRRGTPPVENDCQPRRRSPGDVEGLKRGSRLRRAEPTLRAWGWPGSPPGLSPYALCSEASPPSRSLVVVGYLSRCPSMKIPTLCARRPQTVGPHPWDGASCP